MLSRRRFVLAPLASLPFLAVHAAPSTPAAPLLTLLDGEAFLLRGADRFALAEGVALQPDDLLDLPATARLARIEFPDGATLALGPGSRALLAPKLPGDRAGARIYLLAGWAKLGAPQGVKAGLLSPAFDVATSGGIVVLAVQPSTTQLFAEAGDATVRRGSTTQVARAGELLALASTEGAKPETANRPTPAFVATLPRAFMDTLPLRAVKFQEHPVAPRKLAPIAYEDAQPWLDAEPALRRAYLPRWRGPAQGAEFRRGLVAGMKSHPEWQPILFPPPPPASSPYTYKKAVP